MKPFLWGLVLGSALTNAAWFYRARITAWLKRKDPLAAANQAVKPPQ